MTYSSDIFDMVYLETATMVWIREGDLGLKIADVNNDWIFNDAASLCAPDRGLSLLISHLKKR